MNMFALPTIDPKAESIFARLLGGYFLLFLCLAWPHSLLLFGSGPESLPRGSTPCPSFLALCQPDTSNAIPWLFGFAAIAALYLASFGQVRFLPALILVFLMQNISFRSPASNNVAFGCLGLLLLTLAASRFWRIRGEVPLSLLCYRVFIVATSVGYSFSGIAKLISLQWRTGEALCNILPRSLLCENAILGSAVNYSVVILEIACLPSLFHKGARQWVWLGLTGMHLGALFSMGLFELSGGMLLVQLFLGWSLGIRPRHFVSSFQRRNRGSSRALPA